MNSLKAEKGRSGRWALFLQEYRIKVQHVAGVSHLLADCLSRAEYPQESKDSAEEEFEDLLMAMADAIKIPGKIKEKKKKSLLVRLEWPERETDEGITTAVESEDTVIVETQMENIGPRQRACSELHDMILFLEEGRLPENEDKARKVALTSENYEMIDGVLNFLEQPRNQKIAQITPIVRRLMVPQIMQLELMQAYHDKQGHPRIDRAYATLKRKYR